MERKVVTIYDIAREAGVSTATISRVLNGKGSVSAKKQEEIMRIVNQHNFVTNALAKSLRKTQTKTLGIITSDLRNPFFSNLFIECEKFANQAGYTVFSCDSLEQPEMEISHLKRLERQKVDAIIQIGGSSDRRKDNEPYLECISSIVKRIPIVTTGYAICKNCYSVMTNEANAMELAMYYLISLGHRNIAFIGGNDTIRSTEEKRKQYRNVLEKWKIPFDSQYLLDTEYDKEGGYSGMMRLLNNGKRLSAVIVINEMSAVGATKAIKEKGLRIPEDISVVSFDNTYISKAVTPAMTCVGCNYAEFAEKLVSTTMKVIRGEWVQTISYAESLFVIRDSCMKYNTKLENENER